MGGFVMLEDLKTDVDALKREMGDIVDTLQGVHDAVDALVARLDTLNGFTRPSLSSLDQLEQHTEYLEAIAS